MNSIYDLPEISFAEKSAETIENSIITTYEALTGKTLFPGDPVRLFLQSIAAIIIQQRSVIDFTGKMNLLRYSKGDFLDHVGALRRTPRLGAAKAKTTFQISISAPQPSNLIITKGTRATPGNKIYFETVEQVEIPAGQTTVKVSAECTEPGEIGNGFSLGQINKIVDPFPYFQSIENITISSGGADIEDDESYRQRIYQAPESFSVAGPEGAYVYHAKKASQNIIDVAVLSPSPGEVEIIPLVKEGEVTQDILNAVDANCSNKKVRPLTDHVTVKAPINVVFNIDAIYYIDKNDESNAIAIQNAVNKAKDEYIIWQRSKLGRNINPSELISRVMKAGASRVEVAAPVFTKLESGQIGVVGTSSLNYGGVEDE